MKRTLPHGLPFAPVKVGVLIDIDMGSTRKHCSVAGLPVSMSYSSLLSRSPSFGMVRACSPSVRPQRGPGEAPLRPGRRTAWRLRRLRS